ncbi:MAG TPA: outer membrane lipoprotein carrier protein LolA [Bdellovibrionales bacterium]|nr:outer membrane lipoprotein carrier protein LolA [Bdellovibrionales bacterium]
MQHLKAAFIFVILILLTGAALGARGAEDVRLSAEALAEKLKQYETIDSLEATFKQSKRFKDLTIELKSDGRIKLERKKRIVVWEVLRPSPLKATLLQDELRLESGEGASRVEQTIKTANVGKKAASGLTMLVAWLELDAVRLSKDYDVARAADGRFLFTPKAKQENPFERLEMWLDSKGFMSKLKVLETSGDQFQIEFSAPKITRAQK